MHAATLNPGRNKQRGAAMMVMLVIMVMGGAAFLVSALSSSALKTARQEKTSDALAQAKEALISYAVTYGDRHPAEIHGYLPCPDTNASNGEGSSLSNCGNKDVSVMGRLPWRTLGLPELRDSDGECLWYAISGTYKNNPKTDMLNWDTHGLLKILDAAGSIVAQDVVAVIFAPGAAFGIQNRSPDGTAPFCGGNYTASNYLDSDGVVNNAAISGIANAISQFRFDASAKINDRMIFITKDDIFNAIMRRADFVDPARNPLRLMTQKSALCLADYGRRNNAGLNDKRLPWAGRALTTTNYLSDCNYRDGSNTSKIMYGRLPNRVSGSRSATSNQITQTACVGTNSYYQLKSDGANCPNVPDWSKYYPWWSNWKDHVFYSLAKDYRPAASNNPSCGNCLTVNGAGSYAAIVTFAGKKLSGQTRASSTDQLNFTNYLEGSNFKSSIPINTTGDGDYQSGVETNNFNDVLYCINPDLTVTPC